MRGRGARYICPLNPRCASAVEGRSAGEERPRAGRTDKREPRKEAVTFRFAVVRRRHGEERIGSGRRGMGLQGQHRVQRNVRGANGNRAERLRRLLVVVVVLAAHAIEEPAAHATAPLLLPAYISLLPTPPPILEG